jgi:DedD protein
MRLPFFNRPSTKNNTPVEDNLTEDPERQKARHRLIGAVFMVTVAVAGLPLIFDSQPKNHANDIAIQIIQPGAKDEKPADAKSVAASEADKKAALEKEAKDSKDSKDSKEAKKETLKEEAKSDKPAPVAKTLDKGEEVIAILEGRQDKKPAPATASPAANGSKYVIQIGAFSSEERVKNWQAKLKEQKVTTYVDIKTNKEGGKLHLLRSGPYADKASAEAAEKKIRYVGLSPKLIEQKAN